MLTRIITIICFITAFLLLLAGWLVDEFFDHYHGTLIPHPTLFWLGGILLALAGYSLIRGGVSVRFNQDRRERRRFIDDLQANGEKIAVDLTTCEIRSTDYTETRDRSDDSYSYSYGSMANIDRSSYTVDVRQSIFIFQQENARTGAMERFVSPVIPKDMTTLSFYFDQQHQTNLYVDKNDRSRYYFDLDFLAG